MLFIIINIVISIKYFDSYEQISITTIKVMLECLLLLPLSLSFSYIIIVVFSSAKAALISISMYPILIPIVKFSPKSWMLFVSGTAEADFDWTGKVGVSS